MPEREDSEEKQFVHRRNWEGTFDSTCLTCFRRPTDENKTHLFLLERQHHCRGPKRKPQGLP